MAGPMVGDAFGSMLCEFMNSQSPGVAEIIERDDGFIYVQRPDRYFAAPPTWTQFALALQQRGAAVTGLDVSAGACEISRRRGVRDVVHGRVAQLPRDGRRYDT